MNVGHVLAPSATPKIPAGTQGSCTTLDGECQVCVPEREKEREGEHWLSPREKTEDTPGWAGVVLSLFL